MLIYITLHEEPQASSGKARDMQTGRFGAHRCLREKQSECCAGECPLTSSRSERVHIREVRYDPDHSQHRRERAARNDAGLRSQRTMNITGEQARVHITSGNCTFFMPSPSADTSTCIFGSTAQMFDLPSCCKHMVA